MAGTGAAVAGVAETVAGTGWQPLIIASLSLVILVILSFCWLEGEELEVEEDDDDEDEEEERRESKSGMNAPYSS